MKRIKLFTIITITLLCLTSCKTELPPPVIEDTKKEDIVTPPKDENLDKETEDKKDEELITPEDKEPSKEDDIVIPDEDIYSIELILNDGFYYKADGKSHPTFTLLVNGIKINKGYELYVKTPYSSPIIYKDNIFTTTVPNTYSAYVIYGKHQSNDVILIYTQSDENIYNYDSSLKLSSKVNGNTVTFSVSENAEDVTSASTIYKVIQKTPINKEYIKLDSYTYIDESLEEVSYNSFIAIKDNKVSYTETVINKNLTSPKTVFAKGVTEDSGWYDVNKKGDGRTMYGDAAMCWAASSSNIIQWYQDRYIEKGLVLPENTPNMTNIKTDYELSIFDIFRNQWNNMHGGQMEIGVHWYFTGENLGETLQENAQPKEGSKGNYLKDIISCLPSPYSVNSNASLSWGAESHLSSDPLITFSNIIVNTINKGIAGCTIQPSGVHHAITIWGYEIDEKGIVTHLYVTDSDDLIDNANAPRVQKMHYLPIIKNGNSVGFEKLDYINQYCPIASIISFSGIN